MAVLVGKKAPVFKANAVINGNEIIADFSLEQYIGKKYVIFFFYPKDFTFVCPTELHAFQEKLEAFEQRNTQIVACSTDTEESHWAWLQVPKNKGGIQGVTYPVVADTNKTIANDFDVLGGSYSFDESGSLKAKGELVAYRGLFLIDKEGVVQHELINNAPLGRNIDEAIRLVDALQFFEANGEVCPANWVKGKDGLHADHKGIADYLASH